MNIVLSEDRVIGILPGHPDRETATFHEGHHRSSVAGTGPSDLTQDLGLSASTPTTPRDRHRADHGDGYFWQHSGQP